MDRLFQLPFNEFTAARNALASQLKKAGRVGEAETVKAVVKPPISAWAVNQLYWKHREVFNNLVAAGRQLIQANKSQFAGRAADLPGAQTRQRQALYEASHRVESLLREAGHNPTLDLMRRINATLEALSTDSSLSDTPRPGRLTEDVNLPGFESLASLIPTAARSKSPVKSTQVIPFKSSRKKVAGVQVQKDDASTKPAKAALEAAEQRLRDARRNAAELAAARKKAAADADHAERKRHEAEERYESAKVAEQQARKHLDAVAAEAEKAARALAEASRTIEEARKGLRR